MFKPRKTEQEARKHFEKWLNSRGTNDEFDLREKEFEEYTFIFEEWKKKERIKQQKNKKPALSFPPHPLRKP